MVRPGSLRSWCALALLVGVACGRDAGGEDGAAAGGLRPLREAPDFALETLGGDTLRLSDLAAEGTKVVFLNFWASWCGPCKVEMPDLAELHEKYEDEGFAVLGVTANDLPRESRAFLAENPVPYLSVIGTPQMLEEYRLQPWLPISLIVVDGQIVQEWVGPRPKREFEQAIRVALGKAPPLEDVIADPAPGDADRDDAEPADAEEPDGG